MRAKTKENKKNKFKKLFTKKRIIIIVIILFIVGSIIYNKLKPQEIEEKGPTLQAIERREIATSISAKGTVTTEESKNVTSVLTGSKITSVNVKEGDKINVGDVICTFDVSTISDNVNNLQKQMAASQAQSNISVGTAQRTLNDAVANRESTISQADVDNALNAYNDVNNQLTQANTALSAFKSTYDAALAEYSVVETAYNAANSVKETVANEYNSYKALYENEDPTATDYAAHQTELTTKLNLMNEKEANYLLELNRYNQAKAKFEPIKAQYSQLSAAAQGLNTQAQSLKAAYDTVKKNYDNAMKASDSQIASLNDTLTQAQISAGVVSSNYQTQINAYKKQLADGNLKSTVSGTVTKVNVKKGDIYTGAVICVIEGCEEFIVETQIDEYDIPDIQTGMRAFIKTDATRDDEMEGSVIYTASSATTSEMTSMTAASSGNAKYLVKIGMNDSNTRLRLGMNARISIVTSSKDDVWTVPYDSILEKEDGSKYIEVVDGDDISTKREVNVTTGIEGTYFVELVSTSEEIKDGMKVVIPEVEADSSIENLIKAMGAEAGV